MTREQPLMPQTGRRPLVMVRAARAQYVSAEAFCAEFHKLFPRSRSRSQGGALRAGREPGHVHVLHEHLYLIVQESAVQMSLADDVGSRFRWRD